MRHRDDYGALGLLGKDLANDASFVAGVGDCETICCGLTTTGGCCARRPAIASGVNSISKGSAALSASTSSRVFSGLSSVAASTVTERDRVGRILVAANGSTKPFHERRTGLVLRCQRPLRGLAAIRRPSPGKLRAKAVRGSSSSFNSGLIPRIRTDGRAPCARVRSAPT
jgi:hypothetical protein